MDFMHDRLADQRKIRLLTVVDLYTRECVALEVAAGFRSEDVVRVLAGACRDRDTPTSIRCDNGTEFVALALDQWAFWNQVELDFSRPGTPTDNAFAESFNGRVRAEFLNPCTSRVSTRRGAQREFGGTTTMRFDRTQCWEIERLRSLPRRHVTAASAEIFASRLV